MFLYLDNISLMPTDPKEKICESADSLKFLLYSMHDRHTRLIKRKLSLVAHPPAVVKQQKTLVYRVDTLMLDDLLFQSGSAGLQAESFDQLEKTFNEINAVSIDSVIIEGHTDSTGISNKNRKLSSDRSLVVSEYLQSKLDRSPDKIILRSFASQQPIASNKTPEGRQRNRRVQVLVYNRVK